MEALLSLGQALEGVWAFCPKAAGRGHLSLELCFQPCLVLPQVAELGDQVQGLWLQIQGGGIKGSFGYLRCPVGVQ